MQNNYAAAHKPKREDARAKELADLRRENHELRRTVKRLSKEVVKRTDLPEDEMEAVEATEEIVPSSICDCLVKPIEFVLGGKLFLVCPTCKARKKVGGCDG